MSTETPTPQPSNQTPQPSTNQTPDRVPSPEPAFGFSAYAEQINGRFAMLGFFILLLVELWTRQDLFTWLGLR